MVGLEEIYRRYSRDVYRYAYWISGDATEAEDLTSESFVRAWAGAEDLRTETVKALPLHHRPQSLSAAASPGRSPGRAGPRISRPGSRARPSGRAEGGGASSPQGDAGAACGRPAALLMRAEHSLPYEEIARSLGLSLSAAKVKVHRARIKLASLLRS